MSIWRILVALPVGVVGFAVLVVALPAGCNSYRLARIERGVVNLPHPAGTEPLRTFSALGILTGNGNHCDYFVGHARWHTSTQEQVEAFYDGTSFYNPVSGRYESVEVTWFGVDGELSGFLPSDYESTVDWQLGEEKQSNVYVLVVMRSYEPNADPRCH